MRVLPTTLILLAVTTNLSAFTINRSPFENRKNVLTVGNSMTSVNGESTANRSSLEVADKSPVVIVGGGPAGLLSAIMYAKTFPHATGIQVYDRLSQPPNPRDQAVWSDVTKFYLIGLGGRGQKALAKFGVWDEVKSVCTAVVGRKDWAPDAAADEGIERIFTDRPYTTQVLPRDKLVGVLHEYISNNLSDQVTLNYGYEVTPEDFGTYDDPVTIRVSKCEPVSCDIRANPANESKTNDDDVLCNVDESVLIKTDFLIAADGTGRTVANEMEVMDKEKRKGINPIMRFFGEKPFRVTRYVDDNQRIYKTIPLKLPDDWRHDLNYSARTNRFNIDALPADANGNYCGVLLLKKDDKLAAGNTDAAELRSFFDERLPQFSTLLDDSQMEQIARKEPSFLPSFRFAGPRLHQGHRTLILGDCAHTVKPYFGLGANSALEDVSVLGDILEDKSLKVGEVVKEFSHRRAKESEVLVKISRDLDRPGKLGFFTFLLPLILDSIFNKIAPKVFAPNIISMLQRDGVDFRGVQRRKNMDRMGQVLVLGIFFTGLGSAAKYLVAKLAQVTGRGQTTIVAGLAFSVLLCSLLKKGIYYLNPNLAPADVMPKPK